MLGKETIDTYNTWRELVAGKQSQLWHSTYPKDWGKS